MKRRALFTLMLVVLMVLVLGITAGAAESVTDDNTDTLTLGACTINGLSGVTIPDPTVGLVYTLDSTTMTASVSGRGSFTGGDLVFPSSVTYKGSTYAVTKINSNLFQNLTYNLYVPDSITAIGGGGGTGTFGNSTIDKIYIGSGLTRIEQEVFSGSKGFNTFVCKSKPTYIGENAFNSNQTTAELGDYELDLSNVIRFEKRAFAGANFVRELVLNENVEYIGSEAFVGCSRMNGSIIVPENCELNYRCFNGTSLDRVIIKIKAGETFNAPAEMFSGANGNLTVVFDGPALANNYFFSGGWGVVTNVHFQSLAQIEAFVKSVSQKDGKDRISGALFYSCDNGKYYSASSAGEITEKGEIDTHIYTSEPVLFEKDCSSYERRAYVCYCCGKEDVVSQGTELGEHVNEITIKEANCQSKGYIQYKCTVCDYEETVHFYDKSSHSATVVEYVQKDYKTLEATYKCEHCNTVVEVKDISLVNKCYIKDYGQELFDATLEYVNVSADGVATPSSASFNNAVIYYPTCVEIDGSVVEVKTVQGFKKYSIQKIYIPDSVTRIAGGSGVGCFGDITTLKNIVVGSGITELEQEVFCIGSGGAKLDEFIFKNTISVLKHQCLTGVSASSTSIPYEFNTYLTYAAKWVNLNGTILREVRLAKGCNLSEKFAFNNANGLKTVYIEGGDTPETALDLGQEFTSNTATIALYIKGYVTVSGQAVLSGQNNTRVYMMNTEAIDLFASAIVKYDYKDRIDKTTFMDCSTDTAWYVNQSGVRTAHTTVSYSHGGITEITGASCGQAGTSVVKCFVCNEIVSSTETEALEHSFDGGVITKMPSATEQGTIVYTCLECGQAREEAIFVALGTHTEIVKIYYTNGFDNKGTSITTCAHCDYTQTLELDAIFVVLGYSLKKDLSAITCGYQINIKALEYYENHVGRLEFGVILVNASDVVANGLLDENNSLVNGVRGYKSEITNRTIVSLDVCVKGASTAELKALDFLLSLYVYADNNADAQAEMQYLQHSMLSGENNQVAVGDKMLNTISINRACAVIE